MLDDPEWNCIIFAPLFVIFAHSCTSSSATLAVPLNFSNIRGREGKVFGGGGKVSRRKKRILLLTFDK